MNPLDDHSAEALLSGRDADLPAAWSGVARVLAPLRGRTGAAPPAADLLDRMQAATAPSHRLAAGARRRKPRALVGGLAAVVAATLGFGGLAVADALPSPMQRFVAHALDHVGISVPLPDDRPSIVPDRGGPDLGGGAGLHGGASGALAGSGVTTGAHGPLGSTAAFPGPEADPGTPIAGDPNPGRPGAAGPDPGAGGAGPGGSNGQPGGGKGSNPGGSSGGGTDGGAGTPGNAGNPKVGNAGNTNVGNAGNPNVGNANAGKSGNANAGKSGNANAGTAGANGATPAAAAGHTAKPDHAAGNGDAVGNGRKSTPAQPVTPPGASGGTPGATAPGRIRP